MKNYNLIERALHDLVLSNKFINKSLFELEKFFYLDNKNISSQYHIFITGLPRSGTTSLLNFFYASNEFGSLKYKNMPFIFSPNFSKLLNKKNIAKKERLHGDGITFDINSPEAFDDIFLNDKKNFVKSEFLNYINLILVSENKEKYLSKNNLNYQRIKFINSLLPNSLFLIPIREPLQHSYSLLTQHINFSKLQIEDVFIQRYMRYLGHNEFGLNHKPWNKSLYYNNSEKINYWLEQWNLFYQNIYENYKSNKNCIFVIYEKLTNQNYVKILLEKIRLNKNKTLDLNFFKNSNKVKIDTNYDKNVYENGRSIYEKFKNI